MRSLTYDPLTRIKTISAKDPAENELMSYNYLYDKMANITTKVTERGEYQYIYDSLYRLKNTTNPPPQNEEAFTYDPLGNRLTSSGISGEWNYDSNNELQSYDDVSFVYDSNGNTIQKFEGSRVTSYIYDTENHLVCVETGASTRIATYYYDPFGRRLWKEVGGMRTFFNYSDEGLIGEYASDASPIRTYSYRPGSTWMSDPLFMKEGNEYYYFHNDHLGTPVMMSNVSGATVWVASYSSFGEAAVEPTSRVTNNLRFPGQYYDSETGLHYNWYRYYDPETGRYIMADPIGFMGGLNVFSYVQNNPMSFIDSEGLACTVVYVPQSQIDTVSSERLGEWVLKDYGFGARQKNSAGYLKQVLYCLWHRTITRTVSYYEKYGIKEVMECEDQCGKKQKTEETTWMQERTLIDSIESTVSEDKLMTHLVALWRGPQKIRAAHVCNDKKVAGPPVP